MRGTQLRRFPVCDHVTLQLIGIVSLDQFVSTDSATISHRTHPLRVGENYPQNFYGK